MDLQSLGQWGEGGGVLFPLPVPSVAEGPPPVPSCWCQQCGEEPCGLGCPEWDTGVWRRDALCSWSFPNTIQLSARFWEMRSFPSYQHSQLGCLQRGWERRALLRRGLLGKALALLCFPTSSSPLSSHHIHWLLRLIPLLFSPYLLGNTQ